LPGGQAHYRLPETGENVRLAGGKRTIFTLKDANWQIKNDEICWQKLTWKRFWREVEIFPLVKLHSIWLGEVFHLVLHPRKLYAKLRLVLFKNKKDDSYLE
jgi:hypothetical protein